MAVTAGPKPVSADTKRRYLIQRAGYVLLAVAALVVVVPILYVIGMVVVQGIAAINWEFIFGMPSNGMKAGGIWPAIVGTLILTFTTAVISIPLGVGGAIYLSEYARDTKLTRSIRLAIVNLAGIPSVVYGLFGLGMFVIFLRLRDIDPGRRAHPGDHDAAGDDQRGRGGAARRADGIQDRQRQPGRDALAGRQPDRAAAGAPGHHHRRHPWPAARDGRDRADPVHGGRLLSAAAPAIALRPDDGAAVPSLRHQHAGAGDAAEDAIRHGAGAAGVCAVAQYPGDRDPQLFPAAAAVVERGVNRRMRMRMTKACAIRIRITHHVHVTRVIHARSQNPNRPHQLPVR